jgi:hypothetical protein
VVECVLFWESASERFEVWCSDVVVCIFVKWLEEEINQASQSEIYIPTRIILRLLRFIHTIEQDGAIENNVVLGQ